MAEFLDLQIEIDYAHEQAGWIDCAVIWRGVRHKLAASNVYPPFTSLLHLARALETRRLPYQIYWDEEGRGARFEAWPLAPDSPTCRLRIVHEGRPNAVWVDAEVDGREVARVIVAALREFVHHAGPPGRSEWYLSATDIADFDDLVNYPFAPRSDCQIAQWVSFRFSRSSHGTWWQMSIWGVHPAWHWFVDDSDAFWGIWLEFCQRIARGQLPVELRVPEAYPVEIALGSVQYVPLDGPRWPPSAFYRLHAESVAHPDYFRMRLTKTDAWQTDYLLLDEVLDRRAFIGSFGVAWEAFLANFYQPPPGEAGQVFDLRKMPWAELQTLTSSRAP